MNHKKKYFIVLITGVLFFSCCTNLPGLPKAKANNQTSTTTEIISSSTTLDMSSDSCAGGECCIDDNKNGVCDIDESQSGTASTLPDLTTTTLTSLASVITTTTTQTIPVTTTTLTSSSSSANQCSTTSDCGESYVGGCTCTGSDIKMVRYIPTCRNGSCMFLSKPETVTCRDIKTTDDSVISEKCVQGYSICINQDSIDNYLTTPAKAKVVDNLSTTKFSGEYFGYRFKLDGMAYVGETRCFDSMKFSLEGMTPTGLVEQTDIMWNQTLTNKDITIGIDRIRSGSNSSAELSIWVLKK